MLKASSHNVCSREDTYVEAARVGHSSTVKHWGRLAPGACSAARLPTGSVARADDPPPQEEKRTWTLEVSHINRPHPLQTHARGAAAC